MRKSIFIFLVLLIISGCYKDIDNTVISVMERGPRIVVNASLVGSYKSKNASNNLAFSCNINGIVIEGTGEQIPYSELENIEKKGQFIELFEDNVRTGAAQIPFIENEINYTQLVATEKFSRIDFNPNLNLSPQISFEFVGTEFSNDQSIIISDGLEMVYQYSEETDYLNQLVSFVYGKTGDMEVLHASSSFYIGVEENSTDLKLTQGELIIRFNGRSGQSLFYFDREAHHWEWVSDFAQNLNTEKIEKNGWFVIGEPSKAVKIKGNIAVHNIHVVNQAISFTDGQYQTDIMTSSKGNFECYVKQSEKTILNLLDHEKSVIFKEEIKNNGDFLQIEVPELLAQSNYLKSDFEVVKCDGSLAALKSILIEYENGKQKAFYLENGNISWLPIAQQKFKIYSGDGPKLDWTRDKGEIYYLCDCPNYEDGFTYVKIRTDQKLFPAFRSEKLGGRTYLKDDMNRLNLILETNSKGVLESNKINFSVKDDAFGENGYAVSCEQAPDGCGIEICEITHYKEDGDEWNRIYFEGVIWMQTISPAQAGNFKVEGYILSKR